MQALVCHFTPPRHNIGLSSGTVFQSSVFRTWLRTPSVLIFKASNTSGRRQLPVAFSEVVLWNLDLATLEYRDETVPVPIAASKCRPRAIEPHAGHGWGKLPAGHVQV